MKPPVRPSSDTRRLIIPLAMLLVPDLLKSLRASVSSATDKRGHAIRELGSLASKIFRQFIGEHTSLKTDLATSALDADGKPKPDPEPESEPARDDPTTAAFRKPRG